MQRIEVLKVADNDYTVIVGDVFADRLTADEALACVAWTIIQGIPRFARSYEQWYRWMAKYGTLKTPVALLPAPRI
jgi:hypothetical protein